MTTKSSKEEIARSFPFLGISACNNFAHIFRDVYTVFYEEVAELVKGETMWYTRSDAEQKLEEVKHNIERVEFLKRAFLVERDFDKVMELLRLRVELEGIKAQLEFIIKENLLD